MNPFGGQGKALSAANEASRLLSLCHVDFQLIKTDRAQHAYEIVSNLQIGEFDGILTISGDGLISEVFNAALHRSDSIAFLKATAFGFIPAGTSNGLYASVADHGGERDCILSAAFVVAKGRTTKMDLTELTMEYL